MVIGCMWGESVQKINTCPLLIFGCAHIKHGLMQQNYLLNSCTHTYAYTHAHARTHTHTHTHASTHARTHTHKHTHKHTHTHTHARTHAHTHARTHTHTHLFYFKTVFPQPNNQAARNSLLSALPDWLTIGMQHF